jgi:DNA-binding GntR family transcriptional regulator
MSAIVYSSKAEMVTTALREMIITGALRPGEHLRQRELANYFGVSPTPVREALRRLEAEGLISDRQHRGAIVIESGFGASPENYEIRAMLESTAARLAADKITPAQIAELRHINREIAELASVADGFGRLNLNFHTVICTAAGSPLLLSLIRLLWQGFPKGPQLRRPHLKSIEQHERIIQALESGDGEAAAEAVRFHVLDVLNYREPPQATSQPPAGLLDRHRSSPASDPLAGQSKPPTAMPRVLKPHMGIDEGETTRHGENRPNEEVADADGT